MKLNFKLVVICTLLPLSIFAKEGSKYNFSGSIRIKKSMSCKIESFVKKESCKFLVVLVRLQEELMLMEQASKQEVLSFKEDFGVQFLYSKNNSEFNDLANRVVDQNAVPYTRFIDDYMGAEFVWSPFYSKINIFDKILYFDWMFNVGYQQINTSDNRRQFTVTTDTALTEQSISGFSIGTSLLFHITQNIGIRLDITQLRFESDFFTDTNQSEKYWFKNTDVTVGLNY